MVGRMTSDGRPAFEASEAAKAGAEAVAHRPTDSAQVALGRMTDEVRPVEADAAGPEAVADRPTDSAQVALGRVEALSKDGKAARILAKAEARRVEAEAALAQQDAEAVRGLRAEAQRLEAEAAKAAKAEVTRARWASRARGLVAWAKHRLHVIRTDAAAAYAGFIYLVVVLVAAGSQFVFFRDMVKSTPKLAFVERGGPTGPALAAIFIEGLALAFYVTSVASRLRGRKGFISRAVAWAVATGAGWLQYQAHKDVLVNGEPLLSYALAAASLSAMLLAEVRTTFKVSYALEAADQKDGPQARLGIKFCLRYPHDAFWAVSAMIRSPRLKTRSRALRAGRRMAHMRRRAALNTTLIREAKLALNAARKQGAAHEVTARLEQLAHLGLAALQLRAELASVPEQLALPDEADSEAVTDVGPTPEADSEAEAQGGPEAEDDDEAEAQGGPRSEAEDDEADGPDHDLVWAGRPGGLISWQDRLAELAEVFPTEMPSRSNLIKTMSELKDQGVTLRHTWTNKGCVSWAMQDLRELRRSGRPDPARSLLNPS